MKKFLLLSMGLLLLLGAPVWAEGEEDAEERPIELEDWREYIQVEVPYVPESSTITSKLPLTERLTPASVGKVSETVLREQRATNLDEALYNVAGVNAQGSSGIFNLFFIRGFNSLDGSLVMTDGAPEPEVMNYHMYNVEGVEVLKGPSGVLYGSNPLAGILSGVVNIVRKQPVPSDFVNARASFGSFDTSEVSVDWNEASDDGRFSLRLNGLVTQSEGYRDDKASRQSAINPTFGWQIDADTRVNISLEAASARFEPDAGIPVVGTELAPVPRTRSYNTPFDFSDQDAFRFQVDFTKAVSDKLTLRNKTYYRTLDWVSDGTTFIGVFPDFGTGALEINRAFSQLDDAQRFVGNQFEAVWNLNTGSVKHRLLAGLEVARYDDEFSIDLVLGENPLMPNPFAIPNIDLLNPVETFQGPVGAFPFQFGDAETSVVAPYVINNMEFSEKFHVLAGARFDSIDYNDALNNFERDDDNVSPMLGIVYAPTERFSIYANGSESFAPASPRVIDPNRAPEESRGTELGVKTAFADGKVRANLALYNIERQNIGIPDDNGFTVQQGDQESEGVELEIAAKAWGGVRTLFTYAYTDATLTRFSEIDLFTQMPVDRSGNRPAWVPEHQASLWLSKRFGDFGIAGGARYVGEQFIAEDNVFELGDYVVADAMAYVDLGPWRVQLNVKNIGDEEYETRALSGTSVIPQAGATAFLGVEYRSGFRN
ncbi:hypothetical protein ABI59_19435 [Acidobacteria bacterium Mor1]|nr:hypothetical protein ABI59_19435 [Acidobacteria bacterium Mor1]